jgi:tRNA nucleotidyltransferase (CCA-adding enzyme)
MWLRARTTTRSVMKRSLDAYLNDASKAPISPSQSRSHSSSSPTPPSPRRRRVEIPRMAARVSLTPTEEKLRSLLLDVARSSDASSQPGAEPLVLRWAGGWVRDKLLGLDSDDIDVAINTMTGMEFAKRMRDYCDTPEAVAKHEIGKSDIGGLHHVASNPDKSKHLETAMVRIFGLDLDFVNLRKETYTEDSRNPQMEFGTAEEDALRRDATINALFYNLNTDSVEDFTGGVPDMASKLIRTPLEPLQTFTDDPLRVLRLVRFASRLQFTIDPDTEKYMNDEKVLDSLRVKISRERVGIELEKMLKGKHPCQALRFIDRLKLYTAIFSDPAQPLRDLPLLPRWYVAYECLEYLISNRTPKSIGDVLIRTDGDAYFSWNLAALSPWMKMEYPPGTKLKPKDPPLVVLVAREGFKAPNKLSDVAKASHRFREEIMALKVGVNESHPDTKKRDVVGMKIRDWERNGGFWRLQVLNALLVEAVDLLETWPDTKTPSRGSHPPSWHSHPSHADRSSTERDDFLHGWQVFLDHLADLDVMDAPTLKRLVDGKELSKAFGAKGGLWTGRALDIFTEWQLRNPSATEPAEGLKEVWERRGELPGDISGLKEPST